ncbi:fibronectin type III domain-containing protein 10 [Thalassophryne amazonica]|uniref:fibronectin type III domain-containing protein 10 n=1 Tax=Thalassophryne amazonica TaxID=390379 RepID=UPI001470B016|nr:fibronectin type III domain-containing protein 10 [Thalassophryne amazonica]
MKRQMLPFSALLLCALHQAAASGRRHTTATSSASSEDTGRADLTPTNWLQHSNSRGRGTVGNLKELPAHVLSLNTSRGNLTVKPDRPEDEGSPLCTYQVIEGGIGGRLCFRHTLLGYQCHQGDCRAAVTSGSLVANILTNSSVLLQWTHQRQYTMMGRDVKAEPGTNVTRDGSLLFGFRRHRRGGYELSCWWNGSYTQFECASIRLGSGCSDFVLTELHEKIPYRVCLRSLTPSNPAQRTDRRDCVEFTLPPSGMQDIVIAMTTVGGAICVMLVIICLLVAYITENIMSPTTQRTYSYRSHSRH